MHFRIYILAAASVLCIALAPAASASTAVTTEKAVATGKAQTIWATPALQILPDQWTEIVVFARAKPVLGPKAGITGCGGVVVAGGVRVRSSSCLSADPAWVVVRSLSGESVPVSIRFRAAGVPFVQAPPQTCDPGPNAEGKPVPPCPGPEEKQPSD